MLSRRLRQFQNIGKQLRGHVHLVDLRPDGIENGLRDDERRIPFDGAQGRIARENRLFVLAGRISHVDAQHEPVQLRLGQGICPLEIAGILRLIGESALVNCLKDQAPTKYFQDYAAKIRL